MYILVLCVTWSDVLTQSLGRRYDQGQEVRLQDKRRQGNKARRS
jgi:hypothetical protein